MSITKQKNNLRRTLFLINILPAIKSISPCIRPPEPYLLLILSHVRTFLNNDHFFGSKVKIESQRGTGIIQFTIGPENNSSFLEHF